MAPHEIRPSFSQKNNFAARSADRDEAEEQARWTELHLLLRDLVGVKAAVIVSKLIELAEAGNLSAARYIFKVVGLYPIIPVQEHESDLSLTQTLLRELHLHPLAGDLSGDSNSAS